MIDDNKMAAVIAAKQAITRGAVEIWSVRLELLRERGDFNGLLSHLKTSAEAEDTNLGCNGNCHCGAPSTDPSLPVTRAQSLSGRAG